MNLTRFLATVLVFLVCVVGGAVGGGICGAALGWPIAQRLGAGRVPADLLHDGYNPFTMDGGFFGCILGGILGVVIAMLLIRKIGTR